ncbi:unnamed protein product [Adineta steineri]|uniref:F-box domain-containing protein n=1 Tax=Adineta steineri TaxID=433720 RepID=A0A814RYR6_9BILA|nr:unnamed protein product [Adineta steineri]CAF1491440.1 unnamed protein product [Adineta steineri]
MSTNSGNWSQLLVNKVVFITGAAGHIAKSIAKTCYMHGARLVLGDLDPTKVNKVKEEIITNENDTDDRIFVVKLDVTNETSIQQAVQATLDKWNTIHVLLNTAAIVTLGNIEEISGEDWSHIFDVNVRGYALTAKHIAPIMKKQNSGSIVNISSTLGLIAIPDSTPYSATKGAIIQLTRNLALDLGSFNIRVNTISPGSIDSPGRTQLAKDSNMTIEEMNEKCMEGSCLKRIGQAQDIANLIIFVISDLCPFMTSANLVVDGENLSNELLYEILEKLDTCDIHKSFSNLNNRLQNLITSSSLLLRIKLELESKSLPEYLCQHVIIPNSHRIRSLHLTNQLSVDTFFNHCTIDSTFHRLESIILNGIEAEKLPTTLFDLKSLPRLFSLTIFIKDNYYHDRGDIYPFIFSLPTLTYSKLYSSCHTLQINIPHVINQQFSTIEHLVINHCCTLNELNSLLQHTPQLRHLSCDQMFKSDEEFQKDLSMKLPHLKYIYFQNFDASFDEFEEFIKEISSQLQIFSISILRKKTYLDGDRWERLIKEYMPQLKKFYFQFDQYFDDDREINLSDLTDEFINQFSSPFWIERKLFREIQIYSRVSTFSIHPYRKKWIDRHEHMNNDTYSKQNSTEDNYITNQEKTDHRIIQLTIGNNEYTTLDRLYIERLKSAVKAIQFTHLDIDNDVMSIKMLLDILSSLPNIESLKLSSIPIVKLESLFIEHTKNHLSVLAINKITKVKLGQVTEEQEIEFFINLCPHMQYLEVEWISDTDVPLFMKFIMNRRTRIPNLCCLCFINPMADENMVRTLAMIIDSETTIDKYTIQRSGNKISVHWTL